jgi:hypothetical protein
MIYMQIARVSCADRSLLTSDDMRHALFGSLLVVVLAGCTASPAAPPADDQQDQNATSGKKEPAANSPPGNTDNNNPPSSNPNDPGQPPGGAPPPPPAGPTSKYSCSAAGIAAFADDLVAAGRTSCTSDGVGVVKNDNYTCMKSAITSLSPPHPDDSFNVIDTLLKDNTDYPFLECTYFVQSVTAAVCGTPISPSDVAWTDYPLAYMFVNKQAAGFTWHANDGSSTIQAGDIIVYNTTGGGDPGHIMIVAEVVDTTHFRLAEANELTSSGGAAFQETGVVSKTRVATLSSPRAAGWFRLN